MLGFRCFLCPPTCLDSTAQCAFETCGIQECGLCTLIWLVSEVRSCVHDHWPHWAGRSVPQLHGLREHAVRIVWVSILLVALGDSGWSSCLHIRSWRVAISKVVVFDQMFDKKWHITCWVVQWCYFWKQMQEHSPTSHGACIVVGIIWY